MIAITIFFGDQEVQRFATEKKQVTIGRMENNDICLDNIGISKHHACISMREDGVYCVEDFKSTNGTYYKNQRIQTPQVLEDGDVIDIIKYSLAVYFPDQTKNASVDNYPKTVGPILGPMKRRK